MYLNCKTSYSYRYGTFSTRELVEKATTLGVRAMALTNINATTDCWEFVERCRAAAIKPVIGTEIRNEGRFCYILLARNEVGLGKINRFLSRYKGANHPFPERPLVDDDLYVIYDHGHLTPGDLRKNELIGITPWKINKVIFEPVNQFPECYVIRQPVTFCDKLHYNLHRLLRAIDLNTLVSKLTESDLAHAGELFLPPADLSRLYSGYPAMLARTIRLMDSCGIDTSLYDRQAHDETGKNKKTFTGSFDGDRRLLRTLALENIPHRYSESPVAGQEIHERVNKELRVIDKLGFNAYYLIVWDVVRYAIERGFFFVGRGSGANSIIAYLLRITDVEPITFDLYFERFLNQFRSSPPDFDIDFSYRDRDEIFRYVFERYGKEHVALLGMQSTFKSRASLRELGKVLGLPKAEIDQLAYDRRATFTEDSIQRKILKYGKLMHGMPNHHSIHAGGILISEAPIASYSALELPPKGFATTQWDMFEAERIGLFKLDILSQRGLGHIRDTIALVKGNQGIEIDITQVQRFMADPTVAARLRCADTVGCFYIESPGMRQLLGKLECDDYRTLVAASSIIRPGVAQSGMMKQYIWNYRHRDKISYLHPKMEELLTETFGVMVYQEDVIKVAHHFGGLDMAESDILRRIMSGKSREGDQLLELKTRFFENCRANKYPEKVIEEVWRQIASFAGFSFSKAHSACLAVESYQSLYLKTYYPKEFMVAVINNFGGFYRTPFYFHELKRTGALLHAPCVNRSEILTSIVGDEVFVGFVHIEKLTEELKNAIISERQAGGVFAGLQDFIDRVRPGMEQLCLLIRTGALRFTGISKKELLWRANFLQRKMQKTAVGIGLFQEPETEFQLPAFEHYPLEDAYDEIELMGFVLGDPFSLVDDDRSGLSLVIDLPGLLGAEVVMLGRLVCSKDSRTRKGEPMIFGTFLDENGDWLDTIHWPDTLVHSPLSGDGFYRMSGRVVEEFGVISLEIRTMKKCGYKKAYPQHQPDTGSFRRH